MKLKMKLDNGKQTEYNKKQESNSEGGCYERAEMHRAGTE